MTPICSLHQNATRDPNPGSRKHLLRFLREVFSQSLGRRKGPLEMEANPEPLQPTSDKHIEENATVSNATVSARKLAANRQNAIHSCGPKTERGKANSSKNAIKHGIFAGKLFSQTEGERLEFHELAAQLVEHYQPVGFREQLLVEQILTELIRNSRILRYEQRVLSEDAVFFTGHSLEKVLRYSTFHGRQLSQLLEQLEDEQSKRQS